jgi:hypothetical protein
MEGGLLKPSSDFVAEGQSEESVTKRFVFGVDVFSKKTCGLQNR